MIRRVWLLYRIEVSKAIRHRQAYVGPVLLVLVVLLAPLLYPISADGIGDYGFIAYVTPLALNFLGFVMLLIYCSTLVASEVSQGSIRNILLRSVTRRECLLAKFLLGYSYAALLTGLVAITSWSVAWARGDLMGVHIGGELVYSGESMVRSYVYGALLALLPQWAGASMALCFSTLSRSTSTAISLSLGVWILSDLAKYPLGIASYLYTTYLEAPWQVFAHQCDALSYPWLPMAWQCVLSSVVVMVCSLLIALLVFRRRNLGSC